MSRNPRHIHTVTTHPYRYTHTQTDRHTDTQTHRHTDRQTDTHTHTHKHIWTHTRTRVYTHTYTYTRHAYISFATFLRPNIQSDRHSNTQLHSNTIDDK
jgi:hypothetical protein